MCYKVGIFVIQNNCILLDTKSKNMNSRYNIPVWDLEKMSFPIEVVNRKLKNNLGLENTTKKYIEMVKKNGEKVYLYLIGNVDICKLNRDRRYIWVHKSVLMMKPNYIPFERKYVEKMF